MNALVKPQLETARSLLQHALSNLQAARALLTGGRIQTLDDQVIATAIAGVEHALLSLHPERIDRERRA